MAKKKDSWDDGLTNDVCDLCGGRIEEDRRKGFVYARWLCLKNLKTNAIFYRMVFRSHVGCALKHGLLERNSCEGEECVYGYTPVLPGPLEHSWEEELARRQYPGFDSLSEKEKVEVKNSVEWPQGADVGWCNFCGKNLELGDWFISTMLTQPPFPPYHNHDFKIYAEWAVAGIKCGCARRLEFVEKDFKTPVYDWKRR